MYPVSSRLERLAALKTTLDRTNHLDEELVRSIILHTCQGNPFDPATFRPMIEARSWTDLALASHRGGDADMVRLPPLPRRRALVVRAECRQPAYWTPCEVDEPHPVLAIAILKAFITALIRPAVHACATSRSPHAEPDLRRRPLRIGIAG